MSLFREHTPSEGEKVVFKIPGWLISQHTPKYLQFRYWIVHCCANPYEGFYNKAWRYMSLQKSPESNENICGICYTEIPEKILTICTLLEAGDDT